MVRGMCSITEAFISNIGQDLVDPIDLVDLIDLTDLVDLINLVDLIDPVDLIDLVDLIDFTDHAEAHGQLFLSPVKLPEQLRSSRLVDQAPILVYSYN